GSPAIVHVLANGGNNLPGAIQIAFVSCLLPCAHQKEHGPAIFTRRTAVNLILHGAVGKQKISYSPGELRRLRLAIHPRVIEEAVHHLQLAVVGVPIASRADSSGLPFATCITIDIPLLLQSGGAISP